MKGPAGNVIAFGLSATQVANQIHKVAENTSNVFWTKHVLARMIEREISSRQVLSVLRMGKPDGKPELDDGDWKIALVKRCAGRPIRVIAALSKCHVSVVTVM